MPQPTPYNITKDFSEDEANSVAGRSTVLTAGLDTELANIATTISEILTNIALIQRDDGDIANASIGIDQLKTEVSIGINAVSDWLTATPYTKRKAVWESNKLYYCLVDHTSGTFSSDLGNSYWSLIIDLDVYIAAALAAQTAAELAETNSQTAQAASEAARDLSQSYRDSALAAQLAAESVYDNFDDRWLGSKTSNPSLDNDGNALIEGAAYWNSTTNDFRIYNGSNWNVIPTSNNNDAATAAPAVSNDNTENYSVGSWWVDVTNDEYYVCLDASTGAAVWRKLINTTDTATSTDYKLVVTNGTLYLEEI